MARKDNSPAISFFSFQDIITSVTGIMFLVMMMLTLMLLLRTMGHGASSPESAAIRELRSQIVRLQEQLAKAASRSEEMKQRLEELRKLDAKTLPQRRDELAARLKEMESEKTRLQEEMQRIQQQSAQAALLNDKLVNDIESLKPEVEQLKASAALFAQQLAEASAGAERTQRMMRFTWKKQTPLQPLLVECGKEAILVGTPGSPAPVAGFPCKGDSKEARIQMAMAFIDWSKTQSKSQIYFMILAKPSMFGVTEALAQMLSEGGFQRGREVLPSDDTIVFTTATEAPKP